MDRQSGFCLLTYVLGCKRFIFDISFFVSTSSFLRVCFLFNVLEPVASGFG